MSGELQTLHSKVLSLLNLNEEILSFTQFETYTELLEMIIITKGINARVISSSHLILLLCYYIGCRLSQAGMIREFGLERIKNEKLNELEISYHPASNETNTTLSFCRQFESLLSSLKSQTNIPSCCLGFIR
ncbi:hypothetical protein BPA_0900018 (plasmid) [Borrelia parkeri SLO]|uniref:DUF3890 domain-containing protein n=1 Tax=Borrelia parkeri SLO TaxID=1313294 RepID=W5SYA2_BORPR|nr:DUF3890 domain-containing protein [Borrelia parkeri]AHH10046.1 hypothetical protein BPA_0900018 [Borrelia parkeri SLO]UPA11039.1 DUF3890 domain-containing protein [Borrelia parkeri]UPA11077.1 DUF3890 domain-containing protein [Borrelia parkeri]UPA11134.1 DUF3890 domain-containing protein [Borrelia parkeri]UPA11172.1 DUF3890 domain-containing protein [Borrelia parkeri]